MKHGDTCGRGIGWFSSGLSWHSKDPVEFTKTLLLYNELEPLFIIAGSPDNHEAISNCFSNWWSSKFWTSDYSYSSDRGWSELMRCALMSYICLNVLYLNHEIHSSSRVSKQDEKPDYRWTSSYQKVLVRCTRDQKFDTQTYPHLEYFGIVKGQIAMCDWRRQPFYGQGSRTTLYHQRSCGPTGPGDPREPRQWIKYYAPTADDVFAVDGYLRQRGLPKELILDIVSLAGYRWKRRIPIADDPLHPGNGQELRKYLNYCWKLLMRCDLLAKDAGMAIDWEAEITDYIWDLWGEHPWKMIDSDSLGEKAHNRFENTPHQPLRTRNGYHFIVDDDLTTSSRAKLSLKSNFPQSNPY